MSCSVCSLSMWLERNDANCLQLREVFPAAFCVTRCEVMISNDFAPAMGYYDFFDGYTCGITLV